MRQVVIDNLIESQGAHTIGCVADCYFKVIVLDLPFASPIAIYRQLSIYNNDK